MQQSEREGRNPWKIATIAIVASLAGAISGGIVVAGVRDAGPESAALETAAVEEATEVAEDEVAAVTAAPAPQPRENCEVYAEKIHTDGGRVVKNGLFGTAVGAGLGAAGGAIVDGGSGAGKGAGIGALVGATAGTAYGLNEESKKKQEARRAYEACLARNR